MYEGQMLSEELKTRGREILKIFTEYKKLQLKIPVIMGGDFNSASHLDWTKKTAWRHNGLTVPWPVSKTMYREGFLDCYRTLFPEPTEERGYTWSPRFKDVLQYRIDYIYCDKENWKVKDAEVLGFKNRKWPSDHAAVWSRLVLK